MKARHTLLATLPSAGLRFCAALLIAIQLLVAKAHAVGPPLAEGSPSADGAQMVDGSSLAEGSQSVDGSLLAEGSSLADGSSLAEGSQSVDDSLRALDMETLESWLSLDDDELEALMEDEMPILVPVVDVEYPVAGKASSTNQQQQVDTQLSAAAGDNPDRGSK